MIKPDECSFCKNKELNLVKDNSVFNPDIDKYEIMDSYVCSNCKTIHVDNKDFKFFQFEVNSNKMLQYNDCNIVEMN